MNKAATRRLGFLLPSLLPSEVAMRGGGGGEAMTPIRFLPSLPPSPSALRTTTHGRTAEDPSGVAAAAVLPTGDARPPIRQTQIHHSVAPDRGRGRRERERSSDDAVRHGKGTDLFLLFVGCPGKRQPDRSAIASILSLFPREKAMPGS